MSITESSYLTPATWPDPNEYVEDIGCGPVCSIDVLCGALAIADSYGMELSHLFSMAMASKSIRDFDSRVHAQAVDIRRWAAAMQDPDYGYEPHG